MYEYETEELDEILKEFGIEEDTSIETEGKSEEDMIAEFYARKALES